MKNSPTKTYILYLLIITIFTAGCKQHPKGDNQAANTDDSSIIITDTLSYSNRQPYTREYNLSDMEKYAATIPELASEPYPYKWEVAYEISRKRFQNGEDDFFYNHFGSMAGLGSYNNVYAYFLKQKNGVKKHQKLRKQLLHIYDKLAAIKSEGNAHLSSYTAGLVEFEIYQSIADGTIQQRSNADIEEQKEYFLSKLRKKIAERNYDVQRKLEYTKTVEELITNNFMLLNAQEYLKDFI